MPSGSQQGPTEEQYQNLEAAWQRRQMLKSGKAEKKQRDMFVENVHSLLCKPHYLQEKQSPFFIFFSLKGCYNY